MKIILVIILLMTIGCTDGKFVFTAKEKAVAEALEKHRGEERRKVFVQCMELAAKMPRQADDDVSDIVEACSQESHYMTNYLN